MPCPYNGRHVFKKEYFLKHLEHCGTKKNSFKKLYKCKIDSFVRFFEEEKEEHYSKCPCRKKDIIQIENQISDNKHNFIQDSDILNQIASNDDFEKSFQNVSIKTSDIHSIDEPYFSQSSIEINEKTKMY